MSIFETFYLLFKADSSQLKKEVDDVKKKTGELTKTSKDSEDQAKKTDNAFSGLAGTLGKVAAGFFSVGAVVSGFKNSFNNTQGIGDLARNFGLDPEKLDAYRKAVKVLGYDAEAATSELLEFAHARNLDPNVALKYLSAFSDELKKLKSISSAQGYGRISGIGPTLISIAYNEEREQFDKLAATLEELGGVTQEDIDKQRAFNAEFAKLGITLDNLFRAASSEALPNLTKLLEKITDFIGYVNAFNKDTSKPKVLDVLKGGNILEPKFYEQFKSTDKAKNVNGNTSVKEQKPDFSKDYGGDYRKSFEIPNQSYYQPTMIPSVTNSQAASVTTGDITINTTAQDAKGIASSIVGEINTQSKTLLAQLQQSNAYFDGGVIV